MGKKILRALTNNIGFKILAIIFAFVMWLVVYNLDDPIKTKTFTTTVNITGTAAVEEMGKWPTIVEDTRSVSFTVSAKRSVISELDDTDFSASADLANLIIDESDGSVGTAKIDVVANKYRNKVTVNANDKYVRVDLENFVSKQFVVNASISGEKSGYVPGNDVSVDPSIVRIEGAESAVTQISKVVASIEINDNTYVTEDNWCQDNATLSLLDADGAEIPRNKLRIDDEHEIVTVRAQLLSAKEVPVECDYEGTPAGGSSVLGVNLSRRSVLVKGTNEALASISSIDLGAVDISRATADVEKTIDITSYLPDGVTLVDSSTKTVIVTVKIEANSSDTLTLNTDNITQTGLESGLEAKIEEGSVSVRVRGNASDIESIKNTTLKGTVDLTGLSAGTHTVEVKINSLSSEKYTWDVTKVTVVITKPTAPATPSTPSTPSTPTGTTDTGDDEQE